MFKEWVSKTNPKLFAVQSYSTSPTVHVVDESRGGRRVVKQIRIEVFKTEAPSTWAEVKN